MYEMFKVKRLRGKNKRQQGRDEVGDLFAVEAVGNPELVKTKESTLFTLVTGFNAREPANTLAAMLNKTYDRFHKGEIE